MRQILITCLGLSVLILAGCSGSDEGTEAFASATPPPTSAATATPRPIETPLEMATAPAVRLRPGELVLAADIDDIPAIFADDTLFVDAAFGSEEWPDDEFVIGVAHNDHARAYPIRLLSSHEIVNDVIGGEPVAVTWCPLCFTAIVFSRVVDGRELTFGVSGLLYRNNLVMYDHQSNTEWSQAVGEGIRGAERGTRLTMLPSTMTTWGAWKAQQPDTEIISAIALGQRADEIVDPYGAYYNSGISGILDPQHVDERLPAQTLVVGFAVGGDKRAYTFETIKTVDIINDTVGNLPLVIAADPTVQNVVVFQRTVAGQVTVFGPGDEPGTMIDEATGTTWDRRTGRAVAGPEIGRTLVRRAAPLIYWFAWVDFNPDTELYGSP